ncbi:thiamine pyrophosphate-dependent dehydrogenase E1 component subunit alpha [Haladaptatus sp. DYSN1]|uniref:thiamine pyrophosphate-dependent dehydrogenase E1 component subunit alpha n=1 Tax=unclassified Haladaptatus TaxID=2622732 RepID=UPI0024067A6F|nr:thiamine pyrophosphate-dependent dehydrogenase E1 component subunit alpha [Haladaptatus sp. DYSN1]
MNRIVGERPLAETPFSPDEARAMLEDMVRARRFDERAIALQRRGWMSGYPPHAGQEASQVGAAHAMAADDWLFPTYRSNAMQLARGVPTSDLLLFRRGHAEFHSGHDIPIFPQTVPIATQIPHATGVGMAAKLRGATHAVVCCFGDGATSEGDFHEGLNFAGVFGTPTVFFCENNNWAISMRRDKQTAAPTIAQKAVAYGFEGVQVDGNDPLAVCETVRDALTAARAGTPVLIESLTYRQGAHTTSDDPSVYRDEDEALPEWRTADPLDRFEAYLGEQGVIDDSFVPAATARANEELTAAVEYAASIPTPGRDNVFDYVYAQLTPRLSRQKSALREFTERHGVSTE